MSQLHVAESFAMGIHCKVRWLQLQPQSYNKEGKYWLDVPVSGTVTSMIASSDLDNSRGP